MTGGSIDTVGPVAAASGGTTVGASGAPAGASGVTTIGASGVPGGASGVGRASARGPSGGRASATGASRRIRTKASGWSGLGASGWLSGTSLGPQAHERTDTHALSHRTFMPESYDGAAASVN